MCLKTKQPKIPTTPNAPKPDLLANTRDAARRAAGAQGVYGNIATSPFGDSNYGELASGLPKLATFGGAANPSAA